jgi:subtilisin family serine protease
MGPLLSPSPEAAAFVSGQIRPPDPILASTEVPLALTGLTVRWLHVLAATIAVGGSVLTWAVCRTAENDPDIGGVVSVARGYEWLFWAAVGALVMTGVGNLGAFAPTLPGGRWRATLDLKLGLLVVVLVGSALRTSLLVRLPRRSDSARILRAAYGATAVGLVAVLTLAEVLAHG